MSAPPEPTIGVLALQGDFAEHTRSLARVGAQPREIRTPRQLAHIDGLIIPGGESTAIARLLLHYNLRQPIIQAAQNGLPLWGTCAGAILLATQIESLDRPALHLIPMTIDRNAYGRQIDSFEARLNSGPLGGPPLHAVFIRAPRIRSTGPNVAILLSLQHEPVAVEYGSLMATTFHPELTNDLRLHQHFANHCRRRRAQHPR